MGLLATGAADLGRCGNPAVFRMFVRIGCGVVSRKDFAGKNLAGGRGAAGVLGYRRLFDFDPFDSRDVRKHQLFADEFSPHCADCVDNRHLGHQLQHVSVCGHGGCGVECRSGLEEGSGGSRRFRFSACVFGYGIWRLAATPKNSPTVKVSLMGSSANGNFFARTPDQLKPILERYAEQAGGVASQGVQLIVIPEHVGPITDASEAEADALLGKIAKETGTYVAIGIERISPNVSWNQERVYSPDGKLAAIYNKHHMLPPFESQFKVGTSRTVLNQASGKWGVEICKDMDFPRLSREYSRDGIGMLIVSASDFAADGWLHGRMAVLRGVESGFSIARAADMGVLTATDDRGSVLSERDTVRIGAPFATVVAEVPVRHDITIYSRLGDWFAWLCIAVFLFAWLSPQKANSQQPTAESKTETVAASA